LGEGGKRLGQAIMHQAFKDPGIDAIFREVDDRLVIETGRDLDVIGLSNHIEDDMCAALFQPGELDFLLRIPDPDSRGFFMRPIFTV